jgi:hypothetical protein
MNLSEVAEELTARLDTIEGLRCFSYPVGSAVPPFAVVLNPDPGNLVYDATFGRGMDRMTLPLVVIGGRATERQAHKDIRAYCDGSGARSIKAVLESGTYESFHTIRVATAGVDGVKYAGNDVLAALFDIDITGQGS